MEIGLSRKQVELDPSLDELRRKGLQENLNENNDWIARLIDKTTSIHAGFLFEDPKTLQKLCLLVSETQNKITDAGWEAFGYHLGLSLSLLKVINHNNFNKEDPCYNVLLAYVQQENASIGKVIEALFVMGRMDVLTRLRDPLNDLIDIILQCHCNISNNVSYLEDTSDYDSQGSSQNNESSLISSNRVFIRPKAIPPAPFIFQNLKIDPKLTSQRIQEALNGVTDVNFNDDFVTETQNNTLLTFGKNICKEDINAEQQSLIVNESLQTTSYSSKKKENLNIIKKEKYGLKILLTFAEDGKKYAEEICKIFRKKRDNYPSIGVLILSEHIEFINKDPQKFIGGAFYQVDYVCPILTPGYYRLIAHLDTRVQSNNNIDAAYVPYIYRLMNSYFISNDCLNDKVRTIIPTALFEPSMLNFLLIDPIFGAWVNLNEVDELAERLLKSSCKKKVCDNEIS